VPDPAHSAPPPRRRRFRPLRLLLRLLGGLGILVLVLLSGVLVFVFFPPSDLLRRAVLPIARDALNHENLQIGALTLRPLSRIELGDLWLGPPAGYEKPLFSVKRIVVRYDISRVGSGLLRVEQVQVERPFVNVESRAGKLSWIAFIEGLPPSEPTPEEEEPPSEPSKMHVLVDRVALIGFGADVDDGVNRARLDSLNLALWAMLTPERNDAHVAIELAPPRSGAVSLAALQRPPGKPPLGAELSTVLRLDVHATQRPTLRRDLKPDVHAAVDLLLRVASKRLQTPWPVPAVTLETRLRAAADTSKDRGRLEELLVRLNDTELLRLTAGLKGIFKPQEVDLLLERLHLPLDLFAPYIRAVEPGVALGGTVEVRRLKVASELSGTRLPRMSGTVLVDKLWAKVDRAGTRASLRDLDVKLALGTDPPRGATAPTPAAVLAALPELSAEPAILPAGDRPTPGVRVHGRIQLGEARGAGATVRGLDLRLASAADLRGLSRLQAFGSKLRLRLPAVVYHHPKMGPLRLGLSTDLRVKGDWRDRQLSLDSLRVELPGLLGLDLSARVRDLGRKSLALRLDLQPAPLGELLGRLPAGLRKLVRGTQLGGKVDLGLEVKGRLPEALLAGQPATPGQLLALPLSLDARVGLHGISVKDRARQLNLVGLEGNITCKGRPSDLTLTTDIGLSAARKLDAGVAVKGLRLPLSVHFTPKQLHARLGLQADQLVQGTKVNARKLRLALDAQTALPPLHRLLAAGRRPPPIGRTRLRLEHGSASFRMASPGSTIQAGPIENRLELLYDPAKPRSSHVSLSSRIAWLTHRQQRARIQGLTVGATIDADVPVQRLAAGQPAQVGRVGGRVALGIKALRAAPPGNPVRGQDLVVTVSLDHDPARPDAARVDVETRLDTLDHDGLQLRVRGLRLREKTAVEGVKLTLPQPVIKLARVDNRVDLTLASVHKRGLHRLDNSSLQVHAELTDELKNARLHRLALRVPGNGLKLDMSATARDLLPSRPGHIPTFEVQLEGGLDNPRADSYSRATFLLPGLRASGQAGVKLRARHSGGGKLRLDTRLLASAFNLWSASGAVQREKTGTSLTIESRLRLRDLNMDLPISQSVTLGPRGQVSLPRPKRSIFERADNRDALYSALRPYKGRRASLALGGVSLHQRITARNAEGKKLSTINRTTTIDRLGLDLAIRQSSLLLDRLYLKLFSGDIAGSLRAQILELRPIGPPDLRLHLKTQITGVNLAYLDPAAKERTAETEVSALLDLKTELCRRYVEGRIEITRLSMKMLDSLLAYLDPNKVNDSVQENRKLINSWYIKMANPRVKLVSIWIQHGNLNMDIELDAIMPVGTILKRNLRKNRIRRLNLRPFLERYLPACGRGGGGASEEAGAEKEGGQ